MESETSDKIECFKEGDILTRTIVHCEISKIKGNVPININRICVGPPLEYIKIENGDIYLKVHENYPNFKKGENVILKYHKFQYGWAKYDTLGFNPILKITEKDLENRLNVFS